MRKLHLLRFFPNYDEQHDAEQDARGDQHLPVWQPVLAHEGKHADDRGERGSEQYSAKHDSTAELKAVALKKEHYLEPLPVQRGEP